MVSLTNGTSGAVCVCVCVCGGGGGQMKYTEWSYIIQ